MLGSLTACQPKAAKEAIGTATLEAVARSRLFRREKIKTIVRHDDSRLQRIFWLSRELGVESRSEGRARDADHTR
jgi:hypothetical protein